VDIYDVGGLVASSDFLHVHAVSILHLLDLC